MPIDNKALVHRWFEEVWNKKREEAIREILDPEVVIHGLGESPGEVMRGPESFVQLWKKFVATFPNIGVTVDKIVAEGEYVVALCSVRGHHRGKEFGVEPTNREIFFTGMVMIRVEEGKFCEGWNSFDFLSLYQQVGMVKMLP